MKQLFLLFSHRLTPDQERDAKETLDIEKCVKLPDELQQLWSNIPPELATLEEYLTPLKAFVTTHAKKGDYALIQGDFGGCYLMVNHVVSLGVKPIYATTTREVTEKTVGDKVEKISLFKHVRFREYC